MSNWITTREHEKKMQKLKTKISELKKENKQWLEISANTFPYVMQAIQNSPKHKKLRAMIKNATTITHKDLAKIIRNQALGLNHD